MNKKIETIACEVENLFVQFEEKKYSHNEEKLTKLLKESGIEKIEHISITECHVISCISKMEEVNGIIIAKNLKMTRGGISKIANRLIEKKLITTYKDDKNQKKIFYKLTDLGEKVDRIHNKLHIENHNLLCNIADNYTLEEQEIILRFIKDLQESKI